MKKKKINVALAWRDEDYFLSLTEEERASLGVHPAGAIGDPALKSITGGCGYHPTYACYETSECESGLTGVCSVCPPEYCT